MMENQVFNALRLIFLSFATLVFGLPLIGADDDHVNHQLQKLVAMRRAWGPKMNSTGATLRLHEGSRTVTEGHTVVRYRMIAPGLPKDKNYSLVMWRLNGQPQTRRLM
jgi:hypothetical protein